MIQVLDYGAGNLLNIYNALKKATKTVEVVKNMNNINEADGFVIPGVGAFDTAMIKLRRYEKSIKKLDIPVLGVCLGLQVMASISEESVKNIEGLNIIKGDVVKFKTGKKVPHMGWNTINVKKDSILLKGIDNGDYFYFVHSYHINPLNEEDVIATTSYGYDFASVVKHENFYAVQFHPERSGVKGLKLLKNFAGLCEC